VTSHPQGQEEAVRGIESAEPPLEVDGGEDRLRRVVGHDLGQPEHVLLVLLVGGDTSEPKYLHLARDEVANVHHAGLSGHSVARDDLPAQVFRTQASEVDQQGIVEDAALFGVTTV